MNLNFESPYAALPKYPSSNEFLFGKLGRISIKNTGLQNFTINIEHVAVNSLLKHEAERFVVKNFKVKTLIKLKL